MSDPRDEDDEALGWGGDQDDPTLAPEGATRTVSATTASAAPSATPGGRTVLDEAEDAEDLIAERELAEAEAASKQMSSAALIAFGVLGGIYLLYTIGWIISFTRVEVASELTFGVFTDIVARTLAIAASPFWFIATLVITQKKDVRYTMLWLVIGMLVLVPWPFLIGRAS
ncbi:hypothetical protein [Herbiconiux sp.]|uniref:hypothetical protein n=1 Tax=Herbiconiux sp. TaxID=1871186 RepID=UPI0025C1459E|nr:hypothetical protein [Herbiconiux sp.]